jgi:hypothetical protein
VNVNAVEGVLELRGQLETEVVGERVAKTSKVAGVREVRSLVHRVGNAGASGVRPPGVA